MDAKAFEEMACALLDKEPGVATADLFRTTFDAQYGVDAIGETDQGLIVQSCKCYGVVRKGLVAQWSQDFLDHWPTYWAQRRVRKFILVVAAPMNSRPRLEDIERERARFAAIDVIYEVWAQRQIQERMRAHRGLVSQYLGGADWVERLCGPVSSSEAMAATVESDLGGRIAELGAAISGLLEERLRAVTLAVERGQAEPLDQLLDELRGGSAWETLDPGQQARIVRLQGSAALNRGDVPAAEAFSREADALAAPEEPRLRALLAMHRSGNEAALTVLGAPVTAKGWSLRAGLLLNLGRLDDFDDCLAHLPADDPETLRLLGHSQLSSGAASEALATLERAFAKAPDAPAVQRMLATALYANALSPLAPPDLYLHPQPVNDALVGEDDAARGRLSRAHLLFADLAARDHDLATHELDVLWSLASLANLDDRRAEAQSLAQQILSLRPTSVYAVGWVLARDLDVDLSPSRAALEAGLREGALEVNGPRALEWLTPTSERATLSIVVNAAIARGGWPADVADEIAKLRARLESGHTDPSRADGLLIVEALSSGDWRPVEAAYAALATRDPTAPPVLAVAEALAGASRWPSLKDAVPTLLAFGTARAIRVAAYVAYNTGQPETCHRILQQHLDQFSGGRLPFDLRALEAEALAALGRPLDALDRAAAIALETRATDDILREARFRQGIGDLSGAVPAVRGALDQGAIGPQEALSWSEALIGEEPDLAQALWRHATQAPLDDRTAVTALNLGFALGLEDERPELMAALNRLADQGDAAVQRLDFDDVLARLVEGRERQNQIVDLYTRGRLPAHLLVTGAGTNLAELLSLEPAGERPPRPLFLRSGARAAQPAAELGPIQTWRLHLDVTALLIGDQLGLLPLLETLETPLRIAASTMAALQEIETGARHNQPSRGRAARRILDALGGRLSTSPALDAWSVVHDPSGQPAAIGLAEVVDGLLALRVIDKTRHRRLRQHLNLPAAARPLPGRHQALTFRDQTLDLLVGVDLLDATLSNFRVAIDADAHAEAKAEVAALDRGQRLSERVAKLRRRLARQLRLGRYEVVVLSPAADDLEEPSRGPGGGAPGRALGEILQAVSQDPAGRLWVEDRLLSSYPASGQAQIIEVLEVLDALVAAQLLDRDDAYAKRLRLREAGALFLPLSVEEVMHHLTAAPLRDGVVIETRELAILRRSVNFALLHQDRLKLDPDDPATPEAGTDRPVELQFPMSARRLAELAVLACWNSPATTQIAEARSDWIWGALRSDTVLRPKAAQLADPGGMMMAALNLAGLVACGFNIAMGSGAKSFARRAAFFAWIERSVIADRLERDPDLLEETAGLARSFLSLDSDDVAQLDTAEQAQALRQSRVVVSQIPGRLGEAVREDRAFMDALDFQETTIISLHDKTFLASVFWAALTKATNGGVGHAPAREDGADCEFRASPSEADVILLGGALDGQIRVPALGLLSVQADRRRQSLDTFLTLIDASPARREALRIELSEPAPPERLMTRVRALVEQSPPGFFEGLASALQGPKPLTVGRFLPPPVEVFLDALRWSDDGGWTEDGALALAEQVGARGAIARLASQPVAIPGALFAQSQGGAPRMITPLARLHRLRALRTGALPQPDLDLPGEVDKVLAAFEAWGELFCTLLRWSARAFQAQPAWVQLSAAARHAAVWSFSDGLIDMFATIGADPAAMLPPFVDGMPAVSSARALNLTRGYDDSAAAAASMSPGWLLLAGLEYALGPAADTLELSPEQLERLRGQLGAYNEGAYVPRPVRCLAHADPRLETWLNRPNPIQVDEGGDRLETMIDETLEALESPAPTADAWRFLFVFGPPALTQAQAQRLSRIIEAVDPVSLTVLSADPGVVLRQVAETAGRLAARAASQAFLTAMLNSLDALLDGATAVGVEDLIEAGAAAATDFDGQGPERFARFVSGLIARRPSLAENLRPMLQRLADSPPAAETDAFRQVLVGALVF